ncbi:MAG: hypothetical protein KIG85_08340 [Thiopseudomonas sp.]|nr:hypothetical protein [Thiopseudomonas sp.]
MALLRLFLLSVLLSGCSFYPLGIPKDQWLLMSPQQQHEARMEQARQDEAARVRREQYQQAQLAQQQQQEEQRALRLRQAQAGDVMQCVLEDVQVNQGKNKWRNANSVAIELLQGEQRELQLERTDRRHQRQRLQIRFNQLSIELCSGQGADCRVLVATGREWQRGKRHAVNTARMRGQLTCQYPPRFWHPSS